MDHKYALVTGASGDIGQAICKELASNGYILYIHYNKDKNGIERLSEVLKDQKAEHYIVQSDFSSEDQPAHLLYQIKHTLDLIVHTSGQAHYGLFPDITQFQLQKFIYTNLTVPMMITKALLPDMIKKKRGNIIFITSIWGITGASCEVLYSTVKGGMNTFVKALSKELAPSGIRVNGVAPGAVETKMLANFSSGDLKAMEEEIPIGRLGDPKEIADAVSFLSSEKATYITGQILSINGGWFC